MASNKVAKKLPKRAGTKNPKRVRAHEARAKRVKAIQVRDSDRQNRNDEIVRRATSEAIYGPGDVLVTNSVVMAACLTMTNTRRRKILEINRMMEKIARRAADNS